MSGPCSLGVDIPQRREGREINMKKITVRKTGTVRLTSAAASFYCHGVLQA
jgi:hypothetical protein